MTLYDCFLFNHELDLLELRLHTLAEVAGKHVLVEAERTLRNEPKPLYYAENRARFAAFSKKIIHVVVKAEAFPPGEGEKAAFVRERTQRRAIAQGLGGARPDDLVMVSDVDEIPRPEALARLRPPVSVFECRMYRYYFNLRAPPIPAPEPLRRRMMGRLKGRPPAIEWGGPVVVRMRDFPGGQEMRRLTSKIYPPWRLDRRGPFQIPAKRGNPHFLRDAAWHFHGVMGAEALAQKMRDSAHLAWGARYGDADAAARLLAEAPGAESVPEHRADLAVRPRVEPLDASFPAWLLENRARFADRILPDPTP